jgi:hypothetical protein
LELDAQNGRLVQINKLESLEDNILFIGYNGHSFSVPASCLPKFEKDSIFLFVPGYIGVSGIGVYNVKDGSCRRLSVPFSFEQMRFSWVLPQFQWD